MWRHEDVWRVLGGGIDFMTGDAARGRVGAVQARASRLGGMVRHVPGAAHPRQRAVGRAGGAVRRRHRRAGAAVRPARDLAGGRAAQGERDRADRRRDGPAADRGVRRGRLRRARRCSRSPAAPRCSRPRSRSSSSSALPNVMLTESIGSSETGFTGIGIVTEDDEATDGPRVTPGPQHDRRSTTTAGPRRAGVIGRLARGGHVPLGLLQGPGEDRGAVHRGGRRALRRCPATSPGWRRTARSPCSAAATPASTPAGEKVFPEEVEGALKSHPDVFDALVIGVPDERLGQRVAALVQPRAGSRARPRGAGSPRAPAGRRVQGAAHDLAGRADRPDAQRQARLRVGPPVRRGAPGRGRHEASADRCASCSASSIRSSASRPPSTWPPRSAGPAGWACWAACASTTPPSWTRR